MAESTLTALLYMAKERYSKYVVQQENVEPLLLEKVERDETMSYDTGGKYWVFPVQFPGGESVGAYLEAGNLPGGPTGSLALRGEQGRINPKLNAFTERITGLSRESIKRGPKGFFDSLDQSIKSKTQYVRNDMARQMWGNGRGVLGTVLSVAGGASPSTVTFTTDTNMQNFRVSMRLDFYDATLADRRVGSDGLTDDLTTQDIGYQITLVDIASRTITVTGDVADATDAVVATDVAVRENTGIGVGAAGEGTEITGLQQLVDDGTLTLVTMQNISRTTFPEWESFIDSNGGTLRPITEDLLQSTLDETETRSGKEVTFIGMNKGQRRQLLAIGLTNVRHQSAKLNLGYTELDWNGKRLFVDRQAPLQEIYMGNFAQLARFIVKEWGSLDVTPGGERIPRRDAFELAYGTYMNLGIKASHAWSRIRDLIEP
jgi:hypothetical protein